LPPRKIYDAEELSVLINILEDATKHGLLDEDAFGCSVLNAMEDVIRGKRKRGSVSESELATSKKGKQNHSGAETRRRVQPKRVLGERQKQAETVALQLDPGAAMYEIADQRCVKCDRGSAMRCVC
jgi:hypothetical protein